MLSSNLSSYVVGDSTGTASESVIRASFSILLMSLFLTCVFNLSQVPPSVYANSGVCKIDLFSQRGGIGENASSSPFRVGERIFLFAYVTYNQEPVRGVPVSFQVNNPQDSPQFVSTVTTNMSGFATVNFTLSQGSYSVYPSLWEAFATSSPAQITVKDIMPFYVLPSEWIVVPDDYPTIQGAINHSNEGNMIFVRSGTYCENVVVNRSISLQGENENTTVIAGDRIGSVVSLISSNVTISGFCISNGFSGIWLNMTRNISIAGNLIMNNSYGIRCYAGENVSLSNNIILNNYYGLDVAVTSYIRMRNNVLANNVQSLGIRGWQFPDQEIDPEWNTNDIDTSNTVNGKPIYYWIGEKNEVVPEDAGYLALIWCSNITVENVSILNNEQGIVMYETADTVVRNSNFSQCNFGIELDHSYNNTLEGNCFSKSGLFFWVCENNTVIANCFKNENPWQDQSISVNYDQGDSFYHNNFFMAGGSVLSIDSNDTWDNGYPSGGNYWSNYTGADIHGGSYQNDSGSDGIGDTPYAIDGNNVDNYPLTKPYSGQHDIGIPNVLVPKTKIVEGRDFRVSAKIINYCTSSETFNLSLYANGILIDWSDGITLAGRSSTTVTFTVGLGRGFYTISAYAWPVPGQTDTSDNTCIGPNVLVAPFTRFCTWVKVCPFPL